MERKAPAQGEAPPQDKMEPLGNEARPSESPPRKVVPPTDQLLLPQNRNQVAPGGEAPNGYERPTEVTTSQVTPPQVNPPQLTPHHVAPPSEVSE